MPDGCYGGGLVFQSTPLQKATSMAHILMVLTSHDQLGDTGKKTGFWLEEFAAPYYVFIDSEVFILKYSVMPSHGDDGNHRHEKAFA